MKIRTTVIAPAFVLTFLLGGCSGGPPASAPVATTKEQRLGLINRVPMSPGAKQRLVQQVEQGQLKGP